MRDAVAGQHRAHAIGGEALRDAVQRHAHAGPPEPRAAVGIEHEVAPADAAARGVDLLRRRQPVLRLRAREREPQRLHGRVEGAGAAARHVARDAQQVEQLGRRRREAAIAVQARQRAVFAEQAHLRLDALQRGDGVVERKRQPGLVRMAGLDGQGGAEAHQLAALPAQARACRGAVDRAQRAEAQRDAQPLPALHVLLPGLPSAATGSGRIWIVRWRLRWISGAQRSSLAWIATQSMHWKHSS